MFRNSDIYTVTEFSRKPMEHIKRLSESRRPGVLGVDGKATVVVQDAETCEKTAALAESLPKAFKTSGKPWRRVDHFGNLPTGSSPGTALSVEEEILH